MKREGTKGRRKKIVKIKKRKEKMMAKLFSCLSRKATKSLLT
jgi:hypothetical protein